MKKAYLLVFDEGAGKATEVSKLLDKIPDVVTWRYDMSQAIYVISEASAETLSDKLKPLVDPKARFAFFEITENRQGWITSESWYLIRNKVHKPAATAG